MSLLVGPASGALVAGGIYYGFSTMIQTRTERHCSDLLELSQRLLDSPYGTSAPPPASERILRRPFATVLKSQWNTQMETLFRTAGEWDQRATDWGRRILYGGDATSAKRS
ncbi:hypothetical protein AcW1_002666 [Taiwanofungus camphoratus]|nr:hypothetical protein AcW1_002666 [Antrodia cinnamomea]